MTVSLEELGIAPSEDAGCSWHPGKPEAYDEGGLLRDLSDAEVADHLAKPEADEQIDARFVLDAEDSIESPTGEV